MKPSKKTLTNKADKLFRDAIRKRGYCELRGLDHVTCGGPLQTMHIITRSNRRLRWSFSNAICGCAGHHAFYTNHPFEWFELIKNHFPSQYAYIKRHRNEVWDKVYPIEELKKKTEAL